MRVIYLLPVSEFTDALDTPTGVYGSWHKSPKLTDRVLWPRRQITKT